VGEDALHLAATGSLFIEALCTALREWLI